MANNRYAILYQPWQEVHTQRPARMDGYKAEFIQLALDVGALKFGEFELKSGRISPYFFNSGMFASGAAAAILARCYAAAAAEAELALR